MVLCVVKLFSNTTRHNGKNISEHNGQQGMPLLQLVQSVRARTELKLICSKIHVTVTAAKPAEPLYRTAPVSPCRYWWSGNTNYHPTVCPQALATRVCWTHEIHWSQANQSSHAIDLKHSSRLTPANLSNQAIHAAKLRFSSEFPTGSEQQLLAQPSSPPTARCGTSSLQPVADSQLPSPLVPNSKGRRLHGKSRLRCRSHCS